LIQKLSAFMDEIESKLNELSSNSSSSLDPDTVNYQLKNIDEIRHEYDGGALLREQLSQLGAVLCASQQNIANQNAVRRPLGEINQRWNKINSWINEREQHFRRALLDMGQLTQACAQMNIWIEQTHGTLSEINSQPGSLKSVEIELCKFRVLQNDISSHFSALEAIQNAAKVMILNDPNSAQKTQSVLDELCDNWQALIAFAAQVGTRLEAEKSDALHRGGDLEKWSLWLTDLLSELKIQRPIGGLPETAIAQLDEFSIMQAEVEQKRPKFEAELRRLQEQFENFAATATNDTWLEKQFRQVQNDWKQVQEKLAEQERRLQRALEDAIELYNGMQEHQDWLQAAEHQLAMVPLVSKLPEPLGKQLAAHSLFVEDVHLNLARMKELYSTGGRIQLICEKKDAIPMKNKVICLIGFCFFQINFALKLVNLKHRTEKLSQRVDDRQRGME
jgi:DNA repair exonuclease SbcCD ATPase subunit